MNSRSYWRIPAEQPITVIPRACIVSSDVCKAVRLHEWREQEMRRKVAALRSLWLSIFTIGGLLPESLPIFSALRGREISE